MVLSTSPSPPLPPPPLHSFFLFSFLVLYLLSLCFFSVFVVVLWGFLFRFIVFFVFFQYVYDVQLAVNVVVIGISNVVILVILCLFVWGVFCLFILFCFCFVLFCFYRCATEGSKYSAQYNSLVADLHRNNVLRFKITFVFLDRVFMRSRYACVIQ